MNKCSRELLHRSPHQPVAADAEKANAAAEELQKVRATVTSQTATLRRQKERTEQLEDVIIDLKHDLDATQAAKTAAEEAVSKAKATAAQKSTKLKAAEAAAAAARDEAAQRSASSNAAHADIQTLLQSMQTQSDNAMRTLEHAHAGQLTDLQNRLDAVQAERNTLMIDLHNTRSQLEAEKTSAQAQADVDRAQGDSAAAPSRKTGSIAPVGSTSRSMSPEAAASMQASLEELQQRNHRLQMALAAQKIATPPPQELQDEVCSPDFTIEHPPTPGFRA